MSGIGEKKLLLDNYEKFLNIIDALKAVSYTHLDVYKRQML